jgi:hypothetical protein
MIKANSKGFAFFVFHKFNLGCLDDGGTAGRDAGREFVKHWYTK